MLFISLIKQNRKNRILTIFLVEKEKDFVIKIQKNTIFRKLREIMHIKHRDKFYVSKWFSILLL